MKEKSFEEILDEQGFFCWKNVGVSMLPLIREGRDLIIVHKRPAGRCRKYAVVLFRRPNRKGYLVLHRILRVNADGTYWIAGDNCCHGETVREEDVVGMLTSIVRNGKEIDKNTIWYKLYVRLWCDFYPIRFLILRCNGLLKKFVSKML